MYGRIIQTGSRQRLDSIDEELGTGPGKRRSAVQIDGVRNGHEMDEQAMLT
ncbi:MAG: hypothetical protein ACLQUY_12000 [Ktedonobacterales bacterium]